MPALFGILRKIVLLPAKWIRRNNINIPRLISTKVQGKIVTRLRPISNPAIPIFFPALASRRKRLISHSNYSLVDCRRIYRESPFFFFSSRQTEKLRPAVTQSQTRNRRMSRDAPGLSRKCTEISLRQWTPRQQCCFTRWNLSLASSRARPEKPKNISAGRGGSEFRVSTVEDHSRERLERGSKSKKIFPLKAELRLTSYPNGENFVLCFFFWPFNRFAYSILI